MIINVYFGTQNKTKDLSLVGKVFYYPETKIQPSKIYNTLVESINNLKQKDIEVFNIITLSPIVLRATECFEGRDIAEKVNWFWTNDEIVECNEHNQIYKDICYGIEI